MGGMLSRGTADRSVSASERASAGASDHESRENSEEKKTHRTPVEGMPRPMERIMVTKRADLVRTKPKYVLAALVLSPAETHFAESADGSAGASEHASRAAVMQRLVYEVQMRQSVTVGPSMGGLQLREFDQRGRDIINELEHQDAMLRASGFDADDEV